MYNLADKSYLQQPTVMAQNVVDATIIRIQEHALQHGLKVVKIMFHGGEPLLAGEKFFRYFVETANARLRPEVVPLYSMQTNATLLSPQWLEVLAELGIRFGISLDGTAEVNDANRVDHQGNGSYERIINAIELIKSNERFFNLARHPLAVVNLATDPLTEYRHFRALDMKGVEFNLPDVTYDNPPDLTGIEGDTPYADWLIPIFDEWFDSADGRFSIRLFENIIKLIFGAKPSTDNIGGRENALAVIETDGGIEPEPGFKACGEGFTKLGLNVLHNAIDEAYKFDLFRLYLLGGATALADKCKQCPVVRVCGGGYLPNRYSSGNGFDNPSIYCKDLLKLILHIQERVCNALPTEMREEMQLAIDKNSLQ